jgi:hypothetical protein
MATSLYSKKDLSAVSGYVSGIELDPRQACGDLVLDGPWPSALDPSTIDISKLRENEHIAAGRWSGSGFDMQFNLVATYQGGRKVSTRVGREWDAFQPGAKLEFVPSAPWGDCGVALSPAVAALATNEVEAGTVSSWSSLHTLLGANPAGVPVDRALLTNLNRVQGGRSNSVRFVHRLAALFWHAVVSDRGRPVSVEIRSPARAASLGSVAALGAEVQQGLTGVQYVPWSAPAYSDAATVTSILWAAAAGKVSAASGVASRFLKFWPTLGHNTVVMVDDPAVARGLTATARVDIDPQKVWFAAVRWCAKYAKVELLDEAVRFQGTLLFSPCSGMMPVMDTAASIALPESAMGVFAAGPILASEHELGTGNSPAPPALATLVEGCVVTSLLLSLLSWHSLYAVIGWYYRHGFTNTGDAAEYCRRFGRHSDQVGGWRGVNANLKLFSSGDVGRIWSRVAASGAQRWAQTTAWAARAPQWEELVNRTQAIPAGSSVYGLTMPLQLDRKTAKLGEWYRVADVPSLRAPDHAFFGLRTAAPGTSYRIRLVHALHTRAVPLHLPVSYRGETVDFAFQKGVTRTGEDFEPIFAITSRREYTRVTDPETTLFHYRWWVEAAGDDFGSWLPVTSALEPPPVPTAPGDSGNGIDDHHSDFSGSEASESGDDLVDPTPEEIQAQGPQPAPKRPNTALKVQLPEGVELETPLGTALSAAQTPQERHSHLFKKGLRFEQLLRAGVPVDLVKAYSTIQVVGLGPPGTAAFDKEIRALVANSAYDILGNVSKNKRLLVLDWMIEEHLECLKAVPPSSTQVELAKTMKGLYALRNGMGTDASLTAGEYWDSLGNANRAALKVTDDRGVVVTRDYAQLPAAARGRIANDDASRDLLYSGHVLVEGIGARLATAQKGVRGEPELALNSVDELLETIIRSAWDAGEEADRDMLVELCGNANQVDTLLNKLNAAREAEAGREDFHDSGRKAEYPSASLQVGGSEEGVVVAEQEEPPREEIGGDSRPVQMPPWPKSPGEGKLQATPATGPDPGPLPGMVADAGARTEGTGVHSGKGRRRHSVAGSHADVMSGAIQSSLAAQGVPPPVTTGVATPQGDTAASTTSSSGEAVPAHSPGATADPGSGPIGAAVFLDPLRGNGGSGR